MQTTMVVMAVGIGSSFGGGIKQLEPVDSRGHIIMNYSIYDAVEAGFNKVVFVIRKDLLNDFEGVIGKRMKSKGLNIEYAFQEIDDVPEKYKELAEGRKKSWCTGQAILACKGLIDTPFLVINVDDYYGKEAYKVAHEYLTESHGVDEHMMVGFVLKNTLSDNGTVTRGVCVEEDGYLTEIVETKGIDKNTELDMESLVSMNIWGLQPGFMNVLEDGFDEFLAAGGEGEYLLPTIIGGLLDSKECSVKVLKSNDTWCGMTYKEDGPAVRESIEGLVESGLYPEEF